jgi:hypothetical protein
MMEFVNGKDDIPYIVENKKCLKPPTRLCSKSAQMEVIELRRFGVCCCKTNDVGKTIIKPPICEWFIVLPTYDVLRDIGPGDFKHNLMNIYQQKECQLDLQESGIQDSYRQNPPVAIHWLLE